MKINSGQAPSTLVPKYIGSDFDKVVSVADNIEQVVIVSDNIEDVGTVADNINYVKEVAEDLHGMPVTMYTGENPPVLNPMPEGVMWYCTTDGRTYVWYTDADSGQWVESAPQSAMKDEATNIFFHATPSNVNPAYRNATLFSTSAPEAEISVAHNALNTPVVQAQFIREEALWVDISVIGAQGIVTLMGYSSGNSQLKAEIITWKNGAEGTSLGTSQWVTLPNQPSVVSLPVTLANIDVLDAGDSYVVKLTSQMNAGGSAVSTILVDGNTSSRFGIIFNTNLIGLNDGIRDGVTTSAPTENAVYDALQLKVGKSQLLQSGNLTSTANWANVPAYSDSELGGSGGLLNAQAKALTARSELLLTDVREALRRSYAEAGYNLVDGSFEDGGSLAYAQDVLLCESDGRAYSWGGALPKIVLPGSTPASSGGISAVAWNLQAASLLRNSLYSGLGFALSGVVATIQNLSGFIPTANGVRILVLGGSAVRDGGEGVFSYDTSSLRSLHDGGTFISPTVPAQATGPYILGTGDTAPDAKGIWIRLGTTGKPYSLRQYGIRGSADDSAAMSAFMQKLAGKKWLIDSTPAVFNIGMTGAAYNNTEIRFAPGCYIKNKNITLDDVGLYGTRAAFYIKDVKGVSGDWYGDGNRANQPDAQNCHNLAIYGARNINLETVRFKELRGDGIYLTQSDATVSSANPNNIHFGDYFAYNSTDDGRNALSIIAGDTITIGKFTSINIGGVVGGLLQPGGFDIEPNYDYQTVSRVKVGSIYVETLGTSGIAMTGKGTSDTTGNISDVNLGTYQLINKQSGPICVGVFIFRASNVRGSGSCYYRGTASTQSVGFKVDAATNVNIEHDSNDYSFGAQIAAQYRVVDSALEIIARNYSGGGIVTGAVTRCALYLKAGQSLNVNSIPVRFFTNHSSKQAISSTFTINAPKARTGTTVGAYNSPADPLAFGTCYLQGGDLSGYSSIGNAISGCGAGLRRNGVLGVNWYSTLPNGADWSKGDMVYRTEPAVSGNRVVTGWLRLTDGGSNVLNTDWAQISSTTDL